MVDFENIQCETVIDIETTSGKSHGLKPICPMLNGTMEHGCVRCEYFHSDRIRCLEFVLIINSDVMGFDVTGVVSEVDLTFPEIQGTVKLVAKNLHAHVNSPTDACDCIQACLDRPTTCAAYVWKFSTPDSVTAGYRTCTLCKSTHRSTHIRYLTNVIQILNSIFHPKSPSLLTSRIQPT